MAAAVVHEGIFTDLAAEASIALRRQPLCQLVRSAGFDPEQSIPLGPFFATQIGKELLGSKDWPHVSKRIIGDINTTQYPFTVRSNSKHCTLDVLLNLIMFELGTQEVLNRHLALSLNPSLIPDIPSDLVSTYQTLSNITETSSIPSKELFQVLPETQKTISLRAETIVMSQSSRNTSHVFALAVETLTISFDSRRLDAILKRLSCGPILSNNDYADVKAILAHAGCDDPAVAVMCDALHLELCIFKLNPHWVVAVNQFWTAMAPCQFRPSATVAVVAWWIKTFDLTKPVRLLITRLLAVVSRSSGTVCYSLKKFSKHPRAAEIFEEAFTSSFHSLLTKDGITDSLAQLFLSMKAANRHTSTSLLLLALMFLSKQPQIELDEAHFSALFPPTAGELLGIYQSCEYKDFQDAVSPR